MKTRTFATLACALLAMGSTPVSFASGDLELVYSGPVEAVNAPGSELRVLGHQVVTRDSAAVGVGSLVNVYGKLLPNGAIANAIVEKVSDYAVGSDSVYVRGRVTAVFAQVGRFSIGGTQVDYTALLSDSSFQLPVAGETIEVVGIQPASRGVVLAAGVIQTGNKLGVIQTGSAAGVIQTGASF
jgi:hypothetical protein